MRGEIKASTSFCPHCGLGKDTPTSSFCAGCGNRFGDEAQPAIAVGPLATQEASVAPHRSRDRGNVAWGTLWGFILWPSIIVMMLAMPKGARREDRVFGYWLGIGSNIALAFVAGIIIAVALSTQSSGAPTEPESSNASEPRHTAPEILTTATQLSPSACPPPAASKYPGLAKSFSPAFTIGPKYNSGVWFVGCAWPDPNLSDHFECIYINDQTLEVLNSNVPWEMCEHGLYDAKKALLH